MSWSLEALTKHLKRPEAVDVVELNHPILVELGVFGGKPKLDDTGLTKEIKRLKRQANKERLRKRFDLLWGQYGEGLVLDDELLFHPTRKWRFDYCHHESKVAVELEGGTNSRKTKSRHTTPEGFREDRKKYLAAVSLGWIVISLTSDMIDHDNVQTIVDTIGGRLKGGI